MITAIVNGRPVDRVTHQLTDVEAFTVRANMLGAQVAQALTLVPEERP